MPWLIAVFLTLLMLTPIAAIKLPISLPIDLRPDRLFLILLGCAWIVAAFDPSRDVSRRRATSVHWALGLFLAVVLVGLLARWSEIVLLDESPLAIKKTLLLLAYGLFFLLAVSSLTADDVPGLALLFAVLGAVAGIGTLWEYVSSVNLFYRGADLLLPGFSVEFAPSGVLAGRKVVVGPTQHGLAITTVLAMALPFALAFAVRARGLGRQILWALGFAFVVMGAIATSRKTAIVAPLVAVGVFAAYRPAAGLKLLPIAGVTAAAIAVAATKPLIATVNLLTGKSGADAASTQGRINDYDAVRPDILSHLLLGRGFGTYDPLKYRILDNTVLGLLVNIGVVGVLSFLLVLLSMILCAHRVTSDRTSVRGDLGAAIVGALAAFLVASLLFDSLGFIPVPYLVMFLAACAVILARDRGDALGAPA